MKPYVHARNAARKYGGVPEDYIKLENFFDQTKIAIPDMRHRAVLHNAFGIFLLEQVFGTTITNSAGIVVSVRDVGEDHVLEDLGTIPTLQDCFREMPMTALLGAQRRLKKRISLTLVD